MSEVTVIEQQGTVIVNQQNTNVVEVVTAGPQGPQGVAGPKGDSGDVTPAATAAKVAAEAAAVFAESSKTTAVAASGTATTKATEAAASAASASTSATAASGSASTASTQAANASASATAAATSATNAAGSVSAVAASATTATTQAGIASTKATEAAASAASASTSATAASGSASTASTQATNASASATAAGTSATNASGSASSAAASAVTATSSKDLAVSSAGTATTKANEASTSATAAATSATNAGSSATAAATSASTATTKASEASTSATTASTAATTATTKAAEATTSASNAATSATNAAGSVSAVAASATTATTQAGIATTKAGEAATSASGASTSASTATTKAAEAVTSATAAATAKTAAETARDQTLAAFDSFDDRYLGQKAIDPALDNDGNALTSGSLYFNTAPIGSGGGMKVYDGSVWLIAYASLSGALLNANNLSDLSSFSAARTNLSIGNVENKSSATIRGEITSANVTTALGFTPYNATNPSGYITGSGSITGNAATATLLSVGADRTKLDGIAAEANNYVHPVNHPASIITQDASNRFVTDAEKATWNAKQPAGTYATGSGTATGTNTGDQVIPTTLPASDVYAWAKAATKPTYTAAEVGAPSFTGTGASGSWGISVTGSAASITGIYSGTVTSSQVTNALGFTPANKAGDTFTGNVFFNESIALGTTTTTGIQVNNNLNYTGSTTVQSFVTSGTVQSDVTSTVRGYNTFIGTQAAAFTLSSLVHFRASQNTFGAGSTVTSQNGFVADASLIGAGTNIGFRGVIPAGTNRFNLYMDGTAVNHLLGDTGIGTATPYSKLEVYGGAGANVGLTLRSANGFTSDLNFGRVADPVAGIISYQHSTNLLRFFNGGAVRLSLDNVGNLTGSDAQLSAMSLKDTAFVYYNSGTTNALDYTNGSNQRWAPATGAQTLSISNWPPTGNLGELLIEGVNLGAATITWPTINWVKSDGTFTTTFSSNGVTLQTSGIDFVYLWTRDAGTTIYGKVTR